ncbi:NADH-quinone oxidoreductase subunit M, partial [Mycobacterium sp. ITM-2017-0098]
MVTSLPVLTALWAVPMVGAAVVMLLPAAARSLVKWVALGVSLAVLALTVAIAVSFDPGGEQFQFVENYRWIPSFGTGYILGIDGIALALVVLTAVLLPLLLIAGWNDARDELSWGGRSVHIYFALTLAVEGMVLISLVSLDILLFYVFFEAMLIPMYFLIGGFGGGRTGVAAGAASKAAVKFLLYNLFGGLIMLAAVVGLYVATADSDAFAAGTFDFRAIVAAVAGGEFVVNPAVMHLLFGGFMFAFAVKAPLWPFHRWLPDAAV